MRKLIFLSFFITFFFQNYVAAQYIINNDNNLPYRISLYEISSIANTGQQNFSIEEVQRNEKTLSFVTLNNNNQNIGFTKDHWWVKSSIINNTPQSLTYYLETGRPITDYVDLYIIDSGHITVQHSGDAIPFKLRNLDHRKSIFKINLKPFSNVKIFVHLKSDGEVLFVPLLLRSYEDLLSTTYLEQLVFGFFYGILLLAAIIYLFFYFGMRDQSFLYYSLYVVFIALMQFSLDGYFYEYITPGAGWFSLHSVLIFATIAAFLLGKYTELFLNVKEYLPGISKIYFIVYLFIGLLFLSIFLLPSFFVFAYPLTNLFGLIILALIVYSIIYLNLKNLPVDKFFTVGILFLIAGFVIFILSNFNIIPTTFLSQNSSKFGTGMEVIFISLSMANRIRKLREGREKLINDLTISNRDLKQFTYITSHNLRAPISNLLGLVALFDNNSGPNNRNKAIINKITESTTRLNDTVSDLINILVIKNNPEIEQSQLNFQNVLKDITDSIDNKIVESNAKIITNFNNSETVYFNKNYLESIFLNLLTNSIKYRNLNKPLVIEIKTKNKDNGVQLSFSDNGSGINMERHKDKIFGMHQRFHSNADSKGVGLYIIKSQIESLGGNIKIESEEGVGTTFTINFKNNSR